MEILLVIALPANQIKQPEKAITPTNTNKTIKPGTWAAVVRSTNTTKISLLSSSTEESKFAPSARNPFIEGTIPQSVLVDISNVTDQKFFFEEFVAHFNHGEHVWGLEAKPHTDGKRLFAEFLMSKSKADYIVTDGVKLPSFDHTFCGFYSLSVDAQILKISISGLPRQYGRSAGGSEELKADMQRNLSPFGKLVDCGITRGIAGIFTGQGYAVLEVASLPTPEDANSLQHELHWPYSHLLIESDPEAPVEPYAQYKDAVNVYATWANMTPYCRYCHRQDHVILDCLKKDASVICCNCNEPGHMAKRCPRKNSSPPGTSNKKQRKTPALSQARSEVALSLHTPPPSAVPPKSVMSDKPPTTAIVGTPNNTPIQTAPVSVPAVQGDVLSPTPTGSSRVTRSATANAKVKTDVVDGVSQQDGNLVTAPLPDMSARIPTSA